MKRMIVMNVTFAIIIIIATILTVPVYTDVWPCYNGL